MRLQGTKGTLQFGTGWGLQCAGIGLLLLSGCGDDGGGPVDPPLPDTTPPAAIAHLGSSFVQPTSLRLVWPAPGDDGEEGRAAEYDVRYSPSVLTADNWTEAPRIANVPAPLPALVTEHLTVNGLLPGTTYYFVVSTADEAGNWSGISNILAVTTLSPPDVVPPDAVDDLTVISVSDSSAVFGWTTTGDDADTGTPYAFDLRWSPFPITDENFTDIVGDAIVEVPLVPGPAGTPVEFEVPDLEPATAYYFALRVVDDAFNSSLVSNNVLVTTLP